MKKIISFILVCLMVLGVLTLSACGTDKSDTADTTVNTDTQGTEPQGEGTELPVHVSDDKYRNYYHIWVCSFEDSNGDETGDLQGIINKLDYINDGDPTTDTDLGLDGIWLSPIMPSDSYHKYDVDDYMDIDPEFGDLETFDKLIEECDKRGIAVILDLVLNHCGTGHEFWLKALDEAKAGNLEGYADYYRFSTGGMTGTGWRNVIGASGLWYEGQFSGEMPEWNLESEKTRAYFEEVAKFWLERGVAGFRLDAVKYMTDEITDGNEFLNWFYTTAQKYNPDVYMVGENWQGDAELYDTYESGIDSQFAFSFATSSGYFTRNAISGNGNALSAQLQKFDSKSKESNENAINAFFLSNHDMVRIANSFAGDLEDQKMAAAAYLLTPGNTFTYYGEELGAKVPSGYFENDAYFRGAMNWDDENPSTIWCTANAYQDWPYGGVKQQTEDENSLLSFYRQAVKVKNQTPQIARGSITDVYTFEEQAICAFKIDCDGEEVMVIHNMSDDETLNLTITADMLESPVIRGMLYANGESDTESVLEGNVLTIYGLSSVVLGNK
ncbi:MAG: hypothetical protein IKB72_05800 [Ruminococcus sp.]|nr:hypothetical protein [Ruminococcus sp.]